MMFGNMLNPSVQKPAKPVSFEWLGKTTVLTSALCWGLYRVETGVNPSFKYGCKALSYGLGRDAVYLYGTKGIENRDLPLGQSLVAAQVFSLCSVGFDRLATLSFHEKEMGLMRAHSKAAVLGRAGYTGIYGGLFPWAANQFEGTPLQAYKYAAAAGGCSVALYPAFSAKTRAFGEVDPKNIRGFLRDVVNEYKHARNPKYWMRRSGKVGTLLAVNMLCDGVIYDCFSQTTNQADEAQ